jgi:hypothetical protein
MKLFLSLFLLMLPLAAPAQSPLPKCPVSGDKHGCFGILILSEGRYEGEFRRNKQHGQGTFTFANGDRYVGEFREDRANGHGIFTFSAGHKYVGQFKDDNFDGQGLLTLANGIQYEGEFKDSRFNGLGRSTYANGYKYVGEHKDGKRNGRGVMYMANGAVSQSGLWANGDLVEVRALDASLFPFNAPPQTTASPVVPVVQQIFRVKSRLPPCPSQRNVAWNNCYGETTIGSGGGYAGEFLNNQYHGRGVFTFADGTRYVGEFRGHRGDGQGTIFRADGSVSKSGKFIDGDLVESFAVDIFALLERETALSQNAAQGALPTCKKEGNTRDCYGTFERENLCYSSFQFDKKPGWKFSGTLKMEGCRNVPGYALKGCPGEGTIDYYDGTTFRGSFNKSEAGVMCSFEAVGSLTYPDGSKFSGSLEGIGGYLRPIQGILKNSDGSSCDCVWSQRGDVFKPREPIRGKYTRPNGDVYEGPFSEGKYDGAGSYTFKSGMKYIGPFEKGFFHGKGDLLNPDGSVKSSDVWINGKPRSELIVETQKWCRGTPRLSLKSLEDFSRDFRVHPNSVSLNRVSVDPEKGGCIATIYSTKGAHQCKVWIDKATNTVSMNTSDFFGGLC